ncbi:hypothetical protein JCM4914_22070 [Streptomyces platensis subsp. malvinus]
MPRTDRRSGASAFPFPGAVRNARRYAAGVVCRAWGKRRRREVAEDRPTRTATAWTGRGRWGMQGGLGSRRGP